MEGHHGGDWHPGWEIQGITSYTDKPRQNCRLCDSSKGSSDNNTFRGCENVHAVCISCQIRCRQ